MPLLKAAGVQLNDEASQSVHELRNTIEKLTGTGSSDKRRVATHIQTCSPEDNKILHFNHEFDGNVGKGKHLKSQPYTHAQKA